MAARSPRRSFATPFVVTLAASLPVAACYVQTRTAPGGPRDQRSADVRADGDPPGGNGEAQPQPQGGETRAISNPPRPTEAPVEPAQPLPPQHAGERPQGQPPVQQTQPAQPVPQHAHPPMQPQQPVQPTQPVPPQHAGERPQPQQPVQATPVARTDRTWTVTRSAGKCQAAIDVSCPTGKPGQPVPTCNPPPPMAYACPSSMTTDSMVKVVQYAGSNACQIMNTTAPSCPPKAMCNPPPPQKVACPQ